MPVISRIGSRSLKVRVTYTVIFLALILGSATMVYPLLLMLTGSVKSDTDIGFLGPYPRFWFDDGVLFQKYVESKYNMHIQIAETSWGRRIGSWQNIESPTPQDGEILQDFLAWREQCPWWWLGHSSGRRLLPGNARKFRRQMYERFDGDLAALNNELVTSERSWSWMYPPGKPGHRYPPDNRPYIQTFLEFAQMQPVQDRIIENPDGSFWYEYLVPTYGDDIAQYNEAHGSHYTSYDEVFLTRRAPQDALKRRDWEQFVRESLPILFIRLAPTLEREYQRFLAKRYNNHIEQYNDVHTDSRYTSFDQIHQPPAMPEKPADQVDYLEFVKDAEACPLESIEIFGPRQAFEQFVAELRDVPFEDIGPLRLPIPEVDLHDCMAQTNELRWEFTTRNYKYVLDYILLHGRGIINTVIYCGLAIGLALLVNPLAAYALSRYKPPSTYTIILFCIATMAFPGEVTMIPAFLLLKRFPLWPLVGGGLAFGIVIWVLSKVLREMPELLRMMLALAVGVLVGVWGIPALTGKPYVSLLNTFAALVLPGMANGYMIFLLKGFFDSLPRELYEAADIDGASEWTKFWSFTMALSTPILAVLALSAFTGAYSAFMMALIIIPDEKMWTIMVWLFQLQHMSHEAVVYTSLVIAAIPTFLVFVFCQGIIMKGIVVPVDR